jgi:uncharacterized coiled-coil protein SlyX
MADIGEVHQRSLQGFQVALQQELAAYRQAELAGDVDEMARAAQQMAGLRASMRELNNMASEAVAMRQPPPMPGSEDLPRRDADLCRKYGVSPNELGVAKNWTSNPSLSDEDKVRGYVENRQRYQHMRATGAYRDDQGGRR